MNLNRLFLTVIILSLALGCGGGGDSGSTSTTTETEGDFYYVRYTEASLNSVSLTSGVYNSSIVTTGLTGNLSSDRTLQVAARANPADLPPDILLILKQGAPESSLSGSFDFAVYGLNQGQVVVGQYRMTLDSNSIATVEQIGTTNDNSVALLSQLPSSTALSFTSDGLLNWGNDWSGAVDTSGGVILLKSNQLFLLGAKVSAQESSTLNGKEFPSLSIMQYADDTNTTVASGSGTATFNSSTGHFSVANPVFSKTNDDVSIPSASRPWRLRPSDTSIIEVSSSDDFSSITEQGFLPNSDFCVIINPDNPARPALLVLEL